MANENRPRGDSAGLRASSSAIGGHGLAGLGGFAEVGILVLPEVVHLR